MKKLLLLATLLLGALSCAKDNATEVHLGGDGNYVLAVSLLEATRGSEDSGLANIDPAAYDLRYILEVYDAVENILVYRDFDTKDGFTPAETKTSFPVRLIPGRGYNFVVWADIVRQGSTADLCYSTESLKSVSIKTETWTAMNELRDAYTGVAQVDGYNSGSEIAIDLTRPFAKLRVVAKEGVVADFGGSAPKSVNFTYTTPVATAFNALYPEAMAPQSKTFTYNLANVYGEAGNKLTLFADYIFTHNPSKVQFDMVVTCVDGTSHTINIGSGVDIERNKLTSIEK